MRNCLRARRDDLSHDGVCVIYMSMCVCVREGSTSMVLFDCASALSATLKTLIFVFTVLVAIKLRVSRPVRISDKNVTYVRH